MGRFQSSFVVGYPGHSEKKISALEGKCEGRFLSGCLRITIKWFIGAFRGTSLGLVDGKMFPNEHLGTFTKVGRIFHCGSRVLRFFNFELL